MNESSNLNVEWRPVTEFEGIYEVSEQGTNISAKDARIAELEAVIPANEPAEGSLQVVKETDASIDSPVVNSYGAAINACENHLKQYK